MDTGTQTLGPSSIVCTRNINQELGQGAAGTQNDAHMECEYYRQCVNSLCHNTGPRRSLFSINPSLSNLSLIVKGPKAQGRVLVWVPEPPKWRTWHSDVQGQEKKGNLNLKLTVQEFIPSPIFFQPGYPANGMLLAHVECVLLPPNPLIHRSISSPKIPKMYLKQHNHSNQDKTFYLQFQPWE